MAPRRLRLHPLGLVRTTRPGAKRHVKTNRREKRDGWVDHEIDRAVGYSDSKSSRRVPFRTLTNGPSRCVLWKVNDRQSYCYWDEKSTGRARQSMPSRISPTNVHRSIRLAAYLTWPLKRQLLSQEDKQIRSEQAIYLIPGENARRGERIAFAWV